MSHQGPPPPPSGKIPPPPPSPKGKGPPPPPGSKAQASAQKSLLEMSASERLAWIKSKDGLELSNLRLQAYPSGAYLLSHGYPQNKRGQAFSKEENAIKETFEQKMQAEVAELLEELFSLEDNLKLPVLKNLESRYNNWKPKRSEDGLNFAYQFLDQEAQKWRQTLAKGQNEISPDDPFYPIFEEKRRIADELHHQYADLFAVYQALPEGEEKAAKVLALREIVQQLQKRRDEIKTVGKALDDSRKALIAAEKIPQDRKLDLNTKIAALKQETAMLKGARDAHEFQSEITRNEAEIKRLSDLLQNPPQDVVQRENEAIKKAKEALQKIELEERRVKLLQSFFDPPASWQALAKKPVKVISSTKPKGRETTGMVKDTQSTFELGFDIQFLPMPALKNLARFFAENANEYLQFLEDRGGLFALMTKINAITGLNKDMNFMVLMDIAEGKIKRSPGTYLSGNDIFKNSEHDKNITPNYSALLARSNRHHNIRDEKEILTDDPEKAFNEKTFKKYTQDRGITVTDYTPPEGKKYQKYYHYNRKIDLSYLSATQFLNLANFFARSPGEFLTLEGLADNQKLLTYLDNLFDNSGLSFEDIVDIASGHLVRAPGKFADPDPRYATSLETERKGNAPHYESFIQQRKDFIEEKKRLEKEAREAEQKRQLAEQEKMRAEKGDLALQKLASMTEDYKRIYKISNLNLEDDEQREPYLLYIAGRLSKESDNEIKELIREKLGLEGVSTPEPISLSQSSASSAESSPREAIPVAPEPLLVPSPSPNVQREERVVAPSEQQIKEASLQLHKVAQEVEREAGFVKSTTPLPKPKVTTGLGLKKEGVAAMMRDNNPDVYQAKLVKNRKDEDGRKMEAFYHAINFLRSPDTANMAELFAKAHRSKVVFSSQYADPIDDTKLEELRELCMLLNFDDKLITDDPRKFQTLLHGAHQKENLVEFRWLLKLREMPKVCAFIDAINEKTKQNPLYKLIVLKGYLYTLQENYGRDPLKYKMGALCQHLIDAIDKITKANVTPEEQRFMDDFLSKDRAKGEYTKFLIDYDIRKGEDAKKQKGAKPARH